MNISVADIQKDLTNDNAHGIRMVDGYATFPADLSTSAQANAVRWLIGTHGDITEVLDLYGHLREDNKYNRGKTVLKPFLDAIFARIYNGNRHMIPKNTPEQVMAICDVILETHGEESIRMYREADEERATLHYLNVGDTYGATLCYDDDKQSYYIGTYGDYVEELEGKGYRTMHDYEV